MTSSIVIAGSASALVLVLASPAFASPPVDLRYDAPPGCPARGEFEAAVRSRGVDFDITGATPLGRTLVVSIRQDEAGYAGAFQVRDADGVTDRRQVYGRRCAEVSDALAVVTAIEIDPRRGSPPASNASATSALAAGAAPSPDRERLRGATRVFPPRGEAVRVGAGDLRFDLFRNATVYGGAVMGLVPSLLLPRYELSLEGANFVTTPEGGQRIAGLVLVLHAAFLGDATYRAPHPSGATTTDVRGLSFGIDLCQSPRYDTRGLVLLFCGGYGGGMVHLVTRDAAGAQIQAKDSGFGSVNLTAEIRYNFGSFFHVGVKIGGGFNVGAITAERADGSRIFSSSVGSAYGLIGLGLHF